MSNAELHDMFFSASSSVHGPLEGADVAVWRALFALRHLPRLSPFSARILDIDAGASWFAKLIGPQSAVTTINRTTTCGRQIAPEFDVALALGRPMEECAAVTEFAADLLLPGAWLIHCPRCEFGDAALREVRLCLRARYAIVCVDTTSTTLIDNYPIDAIAILAQRIA